MKENYLCSVVILMKRENVAGATKQYFSTIIRGVNAQSKEEAIGKFLINIQNIERVETLFPVECFPIKLLTIIE